MSYQYFGVVDSAVKFVRIRVLARLLPGGNRRDTSFDPSELGSTRKVFLPKPTSVDLTEGTAVRFDAQENPKPPPDNFHDVFIVTKIGPKWRVELDHTALLILEETEKEADRLMASRPPGTKLYVQTGGEFRGPWRVGDDGKSLLPLPGGVYKENRVFRFKEGSWDEAMLCEDWFPRAGVRAYLLSEIDPHRGEPIDLADGSQLLHWFLKLADKDSELGPILRRLDQEAEGWRKSLKERFKTIEDEIERKIHLGRLGRLEEILRTVEAGGDHLSELSRSSLFSNLWSRALEERHEELEKEARQRLQPEIDKLESQRRQEEKRLEKTRAEIRPYLDDQKKAERRVAEQVRHISEHGDRLVRDAVALQGILAAVHPSVRPASSNRDVPKIAELFAAPLPEAPAEEMASREFADGQVRDALGRLGLPGEDSRLLQATVLACRAVLLPGALWARAYIDALNASGSLLLLQVEPHWLSFRDAWQAGLHAAWEAAGKDPDRLYLIHLQDLDRAPPELWLRPALDILTGVREMLPSGETWPGNLRLTASLSPDDACLVLSPWAVAHFAAPAPPDEIGEASLPDSIISKLAKSPVWRSWMKTPTTLDFKSASA